jgi:hypothetical protein
MLILLILFLLIFCGGFGYYGSNRWGAGPGIGGGLGLVILIIILFYFFGGFRL